MPTLFELVQLIQQLNHKPIVPLIDEYSKKKARLIHVVMVHKPMSLDVTNREPRIDLASPIYTK